MRRDSAGGVDGASSFPQAIYAFRTFEQPIMMSTITLSLLRFVTSGGVGDRLSLLREESLRLALKKYA